MKRITIALLLSLGLASFIAIKTKEELWLRGLVENVKANDLKKFRGMVINEQEFATVIQNSTWSPEKKASMKKRMTQTFLDEYSKKNFDQIAATVNDGKILWSKTIIDSVTYKVQQIEGIEEMKFRIYLSQEKRKYQLSADKCLKTALGWKLSNGVQLSILSK